MVPYEDIRSKKYYADYDGVRFYFTSQTHAYRFQEMLEDRIRVVEERLLRQYHVIAECAPMAAFWEYRRIEPHDFLITMDGKDYTSYRDVKVKMSLEGNG